MFHGARSSEENDGMEITRNRPSLYGDIAHGLGFWTERSAVHEAAAQGGAARLQQLIRDGAAVDAPAADSVTPLHEACVRGHARCVALLLAAGAQVDARNIDGSTPLCDACAAGSPECVKLLLEHGAAVNPPFFTFSPLHEACMRGNLDCVELLIQHGASMEAHDCRYGTPLHVACASKHYLCAKLLLNAGQWKTNQKCPSGPPSLGSVSDLFGTCFMLRVLSGIFSPPAPACNRPALACPGLPGPRPAQARPPNLIRSSSVPAQLPFSFKGANVNAAKLHETVLHAAAKARHVELIELLVEFGADLHARDNADKKAVHYTPLGSPAHLCFRFYEDTPLSLQQLARLALRRILGVKALHVFSQLDLPKRTLAFLSYAPAPVFQV
ncbi:ankyrin repeat and SOCS box protein 13 isoform X1 [Syngnathus scovelli]|uniref:ankyrin repeat and SOCS box protein 13 isoform X1 n=1 Tax=Syngnathus scovelli TaxID=161590 RepID=UPI002110A32F|nr:ankyrin repeat and SOCS box protein 13 isoform X1 [Syngnathus scovelli]